MCGIIGIFETTEPQEIIRAKALAMTAKLRHRGPDDSGMYVDDTCVLTHERLAIMDPEHGAQPFVDRKTGRILVLNGQIYNSKELTQRLQRDHDWQTDVPDEVILYLYDEYGSDFIEWLDGIFAFILYDPTTKEYLIARDHIGIIPLYIGHDSKDQRYVASELKALDDVCTSVEEFPPGHALTHSDLKRWYAPAWLERMPTQRVSLTKLKHELEQAVKRQMMSDVPSGVLLSGGLDSSLIAAIMAKQQRDLHSFSIGLQGSPDLAAAKKVAAHIGSTHHEFSFTTQEGMDALSDVIRHIETFDVTTVRASTPMYLMARKIKALGIKMVLSGEGADEVFGGYLYFHMAPSEEEFHAEIVRKLTQLSKYDCLRANKSMMAWGVEARVPFLDKDLLTYTMSIATHDKMCAGEKMEKHIVREALQEYLPDEIIWRQKEQFSDGVGYGWIDHLKAHADQSVSDTMMKKAAALFPERTPATKEEYLYRTIFEQHFSPKAALTVPVGKSIACSTPTALKWSKLFKGMEDPSGRAVKTIHTEEIQKI